MGSARLAEACFWEGPLAAEAAPTLRYVALRRLNQPVQAGFASSRRDFGRQAVDG